MRQSVLKRGDPKLDKMCQPVENIELVRPIIADMLDTLHHIADIYKFKRGHGLAAHRKSVIYLGSMLYSLKKYHKF